MANLLNFLLGNNSTNMARAAGAPMAANMPGMRPARPFAGYPGQIPGIGGPWTPPINPQASAPQGFPAVQAPNPIMGRIQQLVGGGNPLFDLGLGLLSSSGPRVAGTVGPGERLTEAFQFASQRDAARQRRDAMQREMAEIERQRKQAEEARAQFEQQIRNNKTLTDEQKGLATAALQVDPRLAIGMLAEVPGILGSAPAPQLSDAAEKARDLEAQLGRKLTERERFEIFGAGGMFEATENDAPADEPLSPTDLARVRQPDGSSFPFGTTAGEAQAAGAKVFSEAELKQERDISSALNTLSTLEEMAVGEDGVFKDEGGSLVTSNVLARLGSGLVNGLGSLLGTEASVRRSVFSDTSLGAIGGLVRSMGEAGSLSDGDVTRALALIPQLGATPDTEHEARAKLAELRKIISRGVERSGSQRATEYDFDPRSGRLVPR